MLPIGLRGIRCTQAADAFTIASQARAQNDQQYSQTASPIKTRAEEIRKTTLFRNYPQDLREFILKSDYRTLLPENIANVVFHAFPQDRGLAISSGEMQQITQEIEARLGQVRVFVNASERLQVEEINVPNDLVALDFRAPTESVDSNVEEFLRYIDAAFVSARYLTELAGSTKQPVLVYTSTTHLVVGLGMYSIAAYGLLLLYEKLLNVALKQISVLQAWKTLHDSKVKTPGLEAISDELRNVIAEEIKLAVAEVMSFVPAKVDDGRAHEIKIGLDKRAPILLEMIASGARVSITIESLVRLPLIAEGIKITIDQITGDIERRRALETKLTNDALDLQGDIKKFLPKMSNDNDDDKSS